MNAFTATILTIERERSSRNGNPRWRVTFDNGTSMRTEVDGSVGYGIENRENRAGPVDVWIDRRGNITYLRPSAVRT